MATRKDTKQVPFIAMRARVTRAAKSGDPRKILETARATITLFNEHMWPDNWPSWRNALTDPLPWNSTYRNEIERLFS